MTEIIDQAKWALFLQEYAGQNKGRPTRLGVFEKPDGIANDYWIEDGLPLVALDIYTNKGKTHVDIVFEDLTHSIDGVTGLAKTGGNGADDGLDISEEAGRTTVMRFEDWPLRSED
ncbi:MAG: hypothetical protein ABI646_07055 [Acidobacteriota bacterium]